MRDIVMVDSVTITDIHRCLQKTKPELADIQLIKTWKILYYQTTANKGLMETVAGLKTN